MVSGSSGGAFRLFRLAIGFGVAVIASLLMMAVSASDAKAETVLSSWYGPGFAGNTTANGEVYDPYGLTAAHKTLPLGTELVVDYNGRSVNVVVNDRGPYIAGRDLDLSQGAAEYLGLDQAGVDYVNYSIVGQGYAEPQAPAPQTAPAPQPTQVAQTNVSTNSSAVVEGESYSSSQVAYTEGSSVSGSSTATDNTTVSQDTSISVSQGGGYTDDGGASYIIQSGDTLSEIAASSGVSVDYLASANGINDVDYIVSGHTLHL